MDGLFFHQIRTTTLLAYLTAQPKLDFKISSGDAIVYKVLGNLNMVEQGVALEEILQQIGLTRRINEF